MAAQSCDKPQRNRLQLLDLHRCRQRDIITTLKLQPLQHAFACPWGIHRAQR